MKIALLGNVNNNNFSILRYFRDLGADAHLILFANDGVETMGHFRPEDDTWEIEKWRPYIHEIDVENGISAMFGRPHRLRAPPSRRHLRLLFSGYDAFVGSGLSPAILGRIGVSLDIFYPYSIGIEYVGTHELLKQNRDSLIRRLLNRRVLGKQIAGIRKAKQCLNAEMSLTRENFQKMGKPFLPLTIPMLYNEEHILGSRLPPRLAALTEELRRFEFKLVSHARLLWVRDDSLSESEWESCSKHNDWLIIAYARFKKRYLEANTVLLLLEYGPDVEQTKKLCAELGIEANVLWLPKMPRKEILYLLSLTDVGVGQFYSDRGVLWGGTGWEVLAARKPLIQKFNFTEAEFREIYGYAPPPLLDGTSPQAIEEHIEAMYLDSERRDEIGNLSGEWFNNYNGRGMAKQWLELLAGG